LVLSSVHLGIEEWCGGGTPLLMLLLLLLLLLLLSTSAGDEIREADRIRALIEVGQV